MWLAKGDKAHASSLLGDVFFRDGNIVLHKIHGSYSVKFSAHEQEVNCVDFQGGFIVSGSRDRTAKVSRDVLDAAGAAAVVTSEVLLEPLTSNCQQNCCEPSLCRRSSGYPGIGSCLCRDACSAKLFGKS